MIEDTQANALNIDTAEFEKNLPERIYEVSEEKNGIKKRKLLNQIKTELKYFIKKGIKTLDPNGENIQKAIKYSIVCKFINLLDLLLKYGANPVSNSNGPLYHALNHALFRRNYEALKIITDHIDKNQEKYLQKKNDFHPLSINFGYIIPKVLFSSKLNLDEIKIFKHLHEKYCKYDSSIYNVETHTEIYFSHLLDHPGFKLNVGCFATFRLMQSLGINFTKIKQELQNLRYGWNQELQKSHQLFIEKLKQFIEFDVYAPRVNKEDKLIQEQYFHYIGLNKFYAILTPLEQKFYDSSQYIGRTEKQLNIIVQFFAEKIKLPEAVIQEILAQYLTLKDIEKIHHAIKYNKGYTKKLLLLKAGTVGNSLLPEAETVEKLPLLEAKTVGKALPETEAVKEFSHYNYIGGSLLGISASMLCEVANDYAFEGPKDSAQYISDYVDRLSWNLGSIFANYANALVMNKFYTAQGDKTFVVSQPIINTLLVLAHGLYNEGKFIVNTASLAVYSLVTLKPSILIEHSGKVGFAGAVFEKGSCVKFVQNSGEYIYHNGNDMYEALVGQLNELLCDNLHIC